MFRLKRPLLLLLLLLCIAGGCAAPPSSTPPTAPASSTRTALAGEPVPAPARPPVAGVADVSPRPALLRDEKLAEMDSEVQRAIEAGRLPGGVLWFEHAGARHVRAYGRRAVKPSAEPMTLDTVFDAASLTKSVATAPAVLLLAEAGRVDLDAPLARYLAAFRGDGRDPVTLRHLLTHTSGLRPGIPATPAWTGYDRGIALAVAERPTTAPGTTFRYSDVNYILLGELVRVVTGEPLDVFAERVLFGPLGMADTRFRPPAAWRDRIAPTTVEPDGRVLRGEVHDPTARRMGGVAGHAGLFTTAADLARFARMLLAQGRGERGRALSEASVRLLTTPQSDPRVAVRRGLGMDIDSPYAGPRGRHFPLGSYGHTGWTGTSMWIDPFSRSFVLFLSNRNHPGEDGSVLTLRSRLGTLAAETIGDFNFAYVPGALAARPDAPGGAERITTTTLTNLTVLNGIDVLVRDGFAPLRGRRVGLITNHTGHDRARRSTIDLLFGAEGVGLKALFSPEHGIRGELDAQVPDGRDERTGLPVHSLYGETHRPRPEHLRGLDVLVFDIQDIGCRFYTYVSTMGLAMEAAAAADLEFVVLDRVNPIGGVRTEGPIHTGASSFTAYHALPLRHGMTVGEIARLLQAERVPKARLTVIQVEGWRREAWFDQTSLPWTNPSPNMRTTTAALLYPGIGLLETALSVGRGTDTPFEILGAPYIDDTALARAMNAAGLPGLRFVPVRFTPRASVFKDEPCGGVAVVVTDRAACRPVAAGLHLAHTLQRLHPGRFALDKVQTLLQDAAAIEGIRQGTPVTDTLQRWEDALASFNRRREPFLLY